MLPFSEPSIYINLTLYCTSVQSWQNDYWVGAVCGDYTGRRCLHLCALDNGVCLNTNFHHCRQSDMDDMHCNNAYHTTVTFLSHLLAYNTFLCLFLRMSMKELFKNERNVNPFAPYRSSYVLLYVNFTRIYRRRFNLDRGVCPMWATISLWRR